MPTFQYHPEILRQFPSLRAGVALATGPHNGPAPEPLQAAFLQEQRATLDRLGATPLSEIESLATWEAFFTIEAQHPGGASDVQSALVDLLGLLEAYAGGRYTAALLGPQQSQI